MKYVLVRRIIPKNQYKILKYNLLHDFGLIMGKTLHQNITHYHFYDLTPENPYVVLA
jgi:hypothetical protein